MSTIRAIEIFAWLVSLLYGLGLARPLVCDAEPQLEIKYVRRASDELPTIRQSARDVPVIAQADVVVAGGGCWGADIDADSRPPIVGTAKRRVEDCVATCAASSQLMK